MHQITITRKKTNHLQTLKCCNPTKYRVAQPKRTLNDQNLYRYAYANIGAYTLGVSGNSDFRNKLNKTSAPRQIHAKTTSVTVQHQPKWNLQPTALVNNHSSLKTKGSQSFHDPLNSWVISDVFNAHEVSQCHGHNNLGRVRIWHLLNQIG
jgi:hypothetical protein